MCRIVGRRSTDTDQGGDFEVGAGEIENALVEHPEVAEAAVTGEPDPDLGERMSAWIVAAANTPGQAQSTSRGCSAPPGAPGGPLPPAGYPVTTWAVREAQDLG